MFKPNKEWKHGQEVSYLGDYRPYRHHKEQGGTSSDYPEHSKRILDVKEGEARGINHFFNYMVGRVKSPEAIAVVPSHDPAKGPGGLHTLAARLADQLGLVDASGTLIRHTKIKKMTDGGDRSVEVHLGSVHIPDASSIAGRNVLLLDDVTSTGCSLAACAHLLLDAGAASVKCVALGQTTY
jgi:predicted amidophosphoribosyltransferase